MLYESVKTMMDKPELLKESSAVKNVNHLRGIIDEFIQEGKGVTSFQGKSAEEIRIILKLSKRTVEELIQCITTKLSCYKITQPIYKLNKLYLPFV